MLDDNLILIMCACFGSLSHGEREKGRDGLLWAESNLTWHKKRMREFLLLKIQFGANKIGIRWSISLMSQRPSLSGAGSFAIFHKISGIPLTVFTHNKRWTSSAARFSLRRSLALVPLFHPRSYVSGCQNGRHPSLCRLDLFGTRRRRGSKTRTTKNIAVGSFPFFFFFFWIRDKRWKKKKRVSSSSVGTKLQTRSRHEWWTMPLVRQASLPTVFFLINYQTWLLLIVARPTFFFMADVIFPPLIKLNRLPLESSGQTGHGGLCRGYRHQLSSGAVHEIDRPCALKNISPAFFLSFFLPIIECMRTQLEEKFPSSLIDWLCFYVKIGINPRAFFFFWGGWKRRRLRPPGVYL